MNAVLRAKLDTFHQNAASSRPLPIELAALLESVRGLLKQVAGLWELVPIGSRVTRTHIDAKSTYDYLALIPSFPEDMVRPPSDLMRVFARSLTQSVRSDFGVTVQAPTVQFWYRGEPNRILSIHPGLYRVEHDEWKPGPPPPPADGRTWYYPSGERRWSTFNHAARAAWIDRLDSATSGRLRRIIRLLKAWKYRSDVRVHLYMLPQPDAWELRPSQSQEGLLIYSYFLECGACDWLNRHASGGSSEDDLMAVQAVLADLAAKVRQACNAGRNVFIHDPSGAVNPGRLSASAYDDQSTVAERLEEAAERLAALLPRLGSDEADAAVFDMFGLVDSTAAKLLSVDEPPLRPQGGEPFVGVSDVTTWLRHLDISMRVSSSLHPIQEELVGLIRRRLFESDHSQYWQEVGSVRNGTAVKGYSDRDFVAGLPLITHRNPPQSVLLRFEAALRPLVSEHNEGRFDPPAYVLSPVGFPQLAIDVLPVVRITEVERRWAESRFTGSNEDALLASLGKGERVFADFGALVRGGNPFQTEALQGTTLEPWPDTPEDLVFCSDAGTFHPINPERHFDWLDAAADHSFDGYARVLIRLLKLWKYRQKVPIRSYYIEMFVARWLALSHHVDGRNFQEFLSKMPRSETDIERMPRHTPLMQASEDLCNIICDLHEHLREPIGRGKMPSLLDMSTEGWWARSSPCVGLHEVKTSLQKLGECYGLTVQACAAEREYRFVEAIRLWEQFFRLPKGMILFVGSQYPGSE